MKSSLSPNSATLSEFQKIATEAAQVGGTILQDYAQSGFTIEHKDLVNLVTDADRESEAAIVNVLHRAYPSHQILAEEEGLHAASSSPFKWIIDPLDGTTNFAHGFPMYTVSIGLEYQGDCIVGVVWDPTKQELYAGAKGEGATLNGQPIQVSKVSKLHQALLVTGFGYDIRETADNNLDEFCRFSLGAQGVRRTGTASLDMCYVACGRFDGFWELKLNPWDTAAGLVIIQEAGGRVTNYKNEPFSIYGKKIVASNGLIHQEIVKVLEECRGNENLS